MIPTIPRDGLDACDDPRLWSRLPNGSMALFELNTLLSLIGCAIYGPTCRVVEIGCHKGRTAKAVMKALPQIREYIGVDVDPQYLPSIKAQRPEIMEFPGYIVSHDPRFKLIVSRRGSLDLKLSDLGIVDAMFIDGDHSRAVVEHDTSLAMNTVRLGGVIIWHDYTNKLAQVDEVISKLDMDIKHVDGTWLAYGYR